MPAHRPPHPTPRPSATTAAAVLSAALLAACSSTPPAPAWQTATQTAAEHASTAWLSGDSAQARAHWQRAWQAASASGQPQVLARLALMECATQAAALLWHHCPAYTQWQPTPAPTPSPQEPQPTQPSATASAPITTAPPPTFTPAMANTPAADADAAYARYLLAQPLHPADLTRLPAAQQPVAHALWTHLWGQAQPTATPPHTAASNAHPPLPSAVLQAILGDDAPAPRGTPSTPPADWPGPPTTTQSDWQRALNQGERPSLSRLLAASVALRTWLQHTTPRSTNSPAPASQAPQHTDTPALPPELAAQLLPLSLAMADTASARGWRRPALAWLLLAQRAANAQPHPNAAPPTALHQHIQQRLRALEATHPPAP